MYGERVPRPPTNPKQSRARDLVLPRDDGRNCDYMIGICGMTDPEEKTDRENGDNSEHALVSRVWPRVLLWASHSGPELLRRAPSPDRFGGPAPAPGFVGSAPPSHIRRAPRIAARAHGNCEWSRSRSPDRGEASLRHSPMCAPAWQ